MKFIQLTLHINTEEAETILSFIDELKSVLLSHYGDEIKTQRANDIVTHQEQSNEQY